jgi:hypothetical protein
MGSVSAQQSVEQLVGALREVLDQIDQVDLTALDPSELGDLLSGLARTSDRQAVITAGVIARWEQHGRWQHDGTRNATLALARTMHTSTDTARAHLRRAHRLAHMPATREAVCDGRLSIDHADLLATACSRERAPLFAEHESMLVEQVANQALFVNARKLVTYWTHAANDLLQAPHDPPPPSTLYASRSSDGSGHLKGTLTPIDAEIVTNELNRLATELRHHDKRDGSQRTTAQRRAAALVAMAARSAGANGATPRPLFQVIVGEDTARRWCELASGTVVHPTDLTAHLDTATFETFLFDGPTTILSATKRRTFTGALRRAIQVRDLHCRHPSGCDTPAVDCDIDHLQPAAHHGITSQFNADAMCSPHNRRRELYRRPALPLPPERSLDYLEHLRARLRWRFLREEEEDSRRDTG